MLRRILPLLLLALAAFTLGACDKGENKAASTAVVAPGDRNDTEGWKKYVQSVVRGYVPEGQNARFFVTFAEADQDEEKTGRVVENTRNFLLRGVAEGTLLPFASPDSALMADIVERAFANPQEGKLKGSKVLFIGNKAESDRVREAVAAWGADFAFHEVK